MAEKRKDEGRKGRMRRENIGRIVREIEREG